MKLIVGLGNPGRKYDQTRHNVGFDVLMRLARQYGSGMPRARFQGETLEANVAGQSVLLLTPTTYMNRSGGSVLAARDFYKIPCEDLLVVCDDFNLPLGKLRFRPKGSAGGQKGLHDIIQRLGTDEIPRLRIGIGPVPEGWDPAGFVLGKFTKDEKEQVDLILDRAAAGAADWCVSGIQHCMNQYNAATAD